MIVIPCAPIPISAFDPATTAWVAAVVAAGGTVSSTQEGYVDTFIKALKTNSIFTVWDGLWLLASENTHQAQIDIVNLKTWTINGSPAFTSNRGYLGDGNTAWLDTGLALNTTTNFQQNSGTLGVYVNAADSTTAAFMIGARSASVDSILLAQSAFPRVGGACNIARGDFGVAGTGDTGFFAATRTGSGAGADPTYVYNAGNPTGNSGTSGDVSAAPPAFSCLILAANDQGSGAAASNARLSAAFVGSGLSSGDISNFQSALNTYMSSVGASVY